eukprot:g1465.t1
MWCDSYYAIVIPIGVILTSALYLRYYRQGDVKKSHRGGEISPDACHHTRAEKKDHLTHDQRGGLETKKVEKTSVQGYNIETKEKRNGGGAYRSAVRMTEHVKKGKKPERDGRARKGSPLDSVRLTKKPEKKKQQQQQQQKKNTYSEHVCTSLNVQKIKDDTAIVDHPYVGYPYYEDGECGPPKAIPIKSLQLMKKWCKWITKDFEDGKVRGWITHSWTNGLAFCAMMKRACPDKIDYAHLKECSPLERLQTAFSVAERELGVDSILEPKEDILNMPKIERLSLLLYISMLQPAIDKRLYELALEARS